jgi:hypothetical protein
MTGLAHQMTPPPYDAVAPHTAQVVLTTIEAVLVALTLCYALVTWKRRKTPLLLLILIGGAVAIVNEPALDLISQIYFPCRGSWIVFEAYGRPMAVWGVLSYTLYFGTLVLAAVELLRRGATRLRFWLVVVGVWILNSLLEVVMLRTGIYFYFGYQPLRIGLFPAVWLVLNAVGAIGAAAILLRFRTFFTGPRVLLAAVVAPVCQVAALWIGTAHFILLNSGQSHAVKTLGSLVTIVAGLLVLDVLGRIACRGADDPTIDEVGGIANGRNHSGSHRPSIPMGART